jgi:putative lipoprotein
VLLGGVVACGAGLSDDPVAASEDATDDAAQVTGTLMYRERVALRPGSVAEVWLLDTSLADAPGNPPIPFVLDYDPQEIREGMQYGVRATIRQADQLLFTSDTHYPVLTRGAGNTAEVMLIMVDRTQTKSDASSGDSTR